MKQLKIILFFLIITFFFCLGFLITTIEQKDQPKVTEYREIVNVTRAIDGDTIVYEIENISQSVRMLGINTPEKKERLYSEATNFTSQLKDKEIILIKTNEDIDQYGRLLRYIEYDNNLVNKEILENGLATLYYYEYDSYYSVLKQAEQEARDNKIGMWEKSRDECGKCINLTKLNNIDPGEYITLKNECDFPCSLISWTIRDDTSSHKKILNFSLSSNEEINVTYSTATWNDDKDTFYLKDDKEYLVLFYRYGYQ
jgi:micrococcal nuclease